MNLLLDLGNSRLKWGVGRGRDIRAGVAISHQLGFDLDNLRSVWHDLEKPQHIAVSSVCAKQKLDNVCCLLKCLWPDVALIRARTRAYACGVQIAYQQPDRLGVDRWLCLLALREYYTLPVCVVDCGTAITVDVLDARGVHQGGLIAPGLTLMKQALLRGTERLEYCERSFASDLADDTEAGIYSGTLYAAVGLIEQARYKFARNMQLILTGGDAELIAQHIMSGAKIESNLVLQGLSVFLENSL